jgi:hypothetical protein
MAGNRPLPRGFERAAESITRQGGATTVYDPVAMAALQTRVLELTEYTQKLEERIRDLESKLQGGSGGTTPSSPAGASTPSLTPPGPTFGAPAGSAAPSPGFGPASSRAGTNP